MRILRIINILSISFLLAGCSFSDKFYDPDKNYKKIENVDYQNIWFSYKDTKIHTLLLIPEKEKANQRVVFLIQGKGGNASDWYEFAIPLVEAGYHVWIPEYPGHGLSEGQPSHRSVYRAMNSVVGDMINHTAINNLDIAFWGFSLGANLATKLSVNYQDHSKGLVIDGGCSAFEDVAVGTISGGSFWVRLFVASPYPARDNIKHLTKGKTLIIHSEEDKVMPVEMGNLLYDNANNQKSKWIVNGEHCKTIFNETDTYIEKLEWIFKDQIVAGW